MVDAELEVIAGGRLADVLRDRFLVVAGIEVFLGAGPGPVGTTGEEDGAETSFVLVTGERIDAETTVGVPPATGISSNEVPVAMRA
ncbi:hypothetical protein BH09ACT1_BH09ACT1_10250 [soil metagenome]